MHDNEIDSHARYLNGEYDTPLDDDEVDGIVKSIVTHYPWPDSGAPKPPRARPPRNREASRPRRT